MKGRLSSAAVTTLALTAAGLGLRTIYVRLEAPAGYGQMVFRIMTTPTWRVWGAIALSVASYGVVVAHELVALRRVRRLVVPFPRVALRAFATYVVTHSVGPGFLGGGAIAYRMLAADGLATGEIADVMALNLVTFWLAVLFLGGATLVWTPLQLPSRFPGLEPASRVVGGILLAAGMAYWTWTATGTRTVRLRGFDVTLPGAGVTGLQIVLSALEWVLGAAALYVLLPHRSTLSLWRMIGVFVVARTVGLASHVPAGLGVFDAMIVVLLANYPHTPALVAGLLWYRTVYLLPLVAAFVAFTAYEVTPHRPLASALDVLDQWWPEVGPRALGGRSILADAPRETRSRWSIPRQRCPARPRSCARCRCW